MAGKSLTTRDRGKRRDFEVCSPMAVIGPEKVIWGLCLERLKFVFSPLRRKIANKSPICLEYSSK